MERIGVIGIGKLGVCFALNLERKGYEVIGADIHDEYVDSINRKTLKSAEPFVEEYLKKSRHFHGTTSLEELLIDDISTLFLFVATPSLPDGSYDHSQIERIADRLISHGKRNNHIHLIVGCTTMPGYCNSLSEKLMPYNYDISYNPEFIAQGSIIKNQQYPDQVLIGEANTKSGDIIQNIYKEICENNPVFCRMDRLSAEITKLATNCFLTTKISFANSIGDLAIKTGGDYEKILSAIGVDSRIGNKYLTYGFGFGGPCFPRDNRALGKFANENNYPLLISNATDSVNKNHLDFQIQQYLKKYSESEEITFDFVSYKPDSILIVESQQLALAVALAKLGRNVIIKERPEVVKEVNKLYPDLFTFR